MDSHFDGRAASRLLPSDLYLNVVGEAASWAATVSQVPATHLAMLLIDFNLLPEESGKVLINLQKICPNSIVIKLISILGASRQAAHPFGADATISIGKTHEHEADHSNHSQNLRK